MRIRKFTLRILVLVSFAWAVNSCNLPSALPDDSGCIVTTPPAGRFDPFYTKYCSARGIPILSSGDVPDNALQQAWGIIMNMTVQLIKF